ncbi:hypothetical protein Taro_039375, partial [Colocasia esculenta]|nr:hypothetical protein [Colocasia esculenta]
MGDQKNRWTWEVPGFEPRKSFERDDRHDHALLQQQRQASLPAPLLRRYSLSPASLAPQPELPRHAMAQKLHKLKDQVKVQKPGDRDRIGRPKTDPTRRSRPRLGRAGPTPAEAGVAGSAHYT